MVHSGVYSIENATTGKLYVGSGVDVRERMRRHRKALRDGNHDNDRFQHAWNKYGERSFSFSVLLYCSRKNLVLYEQRAIDALKAADRNHGFNICAKAYSKLGVPCSELSKRVTRERLKGVAPCLENRLITAARNKTAEMRAACSAYHKGRKKSPAGVEKMRASKLGKPLTEKQRNALEPYWDSRRGVPRPDVAAKQIGGKRTAETKAKMSASRKLWWERKRASESSSSS